MNCPVCGAEGADDQPVGPTVTVFCCAACVSTILRSFAGRAEATTDTAAASPARAQRPTPAWAPTPA